ncbi:hypothetical protein [Acinetobacter sp. ANC 4648]|uniref:hypothetical protein n=1 Tax=Acinetobacter sp. ANC 4648 TaxID=1977875 RepID=UPI000A344457|nr:hypothetical protein [Acinetobacter sp. ANC 4648]OTG81513.1 hypothetical protein B9T27_09500 [Acinetobacter sp. ANC 4648]
MLNSTVKQEKFYIYSCDGETNHHFTLDRGDSFTHYGFRYPLPCDQMHPEMFEKANHRTPQRFNKRTLELKGVGFLDCYLHESEYESYAVDYFLKRMELKNLKTIDDLITSINGMILEYQPIN